MISQGYKVFFIFLLGGYAIWGCNTSETGAEISVEKMQYILKEILIADNGVETLGYPLEERKVERERRYEAIFRAAQVTRQEFWENFKIYRSQPALMDSMYLQIIEEISEEIVNNRYQSGNKSGKEYPGDSSVFFTP
jgi:hypothetical protein